MPPVAGWRYPVVQVYEVQGPAEAQLMVDCGVDSIGGIVPSAEEWRVPNRPPRAALRSRHSLRVSRMILPA